MNSSLSSPRLPRSNPRCWRSDPREGRHFLRLRLGPPLPPHGCCSCGRHGSHGGSSGYHWYCDTCDVQFHGGGCQWSPRERRHMYHHQHTLSFRSLVSHHNIYQQCDWCRQTLVSPNPNDDNDCFYRCSLCGFTLCEDCSDRDPELTITDPKKRHPHPLTFFPRPFSRCDACGEADAGDPTYACLQCLYVVHRSCLELPRVVRIMRHPQHRLSHVPHLSPPSDRSCGVCHRPVDPKYGAFSCTREGCSYALHSICLSRPDVWDGKDLEGVPEEPEVIEEPFRRISDKEIEHFSHVEHPLCLIDGSGGEVYDKQCQACVVPMGFASSFYSCRQCDFFLHTECASLPRKLYHALHRHPLFLRPFPARGSNCMCCLACTRVSCGFSYRCIEESCSEFRIDVRCASGICDPVVHHLHPHPLFIHLRQSRVGRFYCSICDKFIGFRHLKCFDEGCDFGMCFSCASLPRELSYRYDRHPLALSRYGEEEEDATSGGTYWCEVCEQTLDPRKPFYACEECCTTLHVDCIFGPSIFMKAGRTFTFPGKTTEVEVVGNSRSTRPLCDECHRRCPNTVFFKVTERCFCSFDCLDEEVPHVWHM